MHRPEILDSTLREGEQTPGVHFTVNQKVEIAKRLDAFGVDFIEAGHPSVSADIRAGLAAVAAEGLNAHVLAHARAVEADIDAARQCDADWVGIFFSVRDEALEQRFRKDMDQAVAVVQRAVSYAKAHGLRVRYTPEDTVRSPWANVSRIATAAVEAGADRISVADTTGHMTPSGMHAFIRRLSETVDVPLNVHCHNDLGMAVANSLAAYEAGAALIDVTVNGLGERTGIAPLAETTVALKLRYGAPNTWRLDMLPEISAMVAEASAIPVAAQAPIVGANAFRHNAGLHVAAVLVDPAHYESVPAALVGRTRSVPLDRFAGLHTLQYKCRELGLKADPATMQRVLDRIKREERRHVDDDEFCAWIETDRTLSVAMPTAAPPA
jgi:2-isopropylmalate synthase